MRKKILNLGCGEKKIPGAVNVDCNESIKPDIVCNLDHFPYPFNKNSFDEVYCHHVLEHLEDLMSVMKELHRVTKPAGKIFIESPHFSYVNAYKDPTHKHFFSIDSFDYFCNKNEWSYYVKNKIAFIPESKTIVFQKGLFRWAIQSFFNKHTKLYESKLAWIIPAERIKLVLVKA